LKNRKKRDEAMGTEHNVEELFALAFQDDLTGLYNRRYLQKTLAPSLEGTGPEDPYCFLLLDIDYFKEINDTYGHKDGDRALVSVAELLKTSVQEEQSAIRYAGDEFILFLPRLGREDGFQKAREIVEKGRELTIPVTGEGKAFHLSFSVGVASFPQDGLHWENIVEKADDVLFAAKQQGRDRASLPPEGESEIRRGDDLSRIFPCPDHVGREEILGQVLEKIRSRHGKDAKADPLFLFIQGGRGCGKSRFLNEVGESIRKEQACVLHLHGSELLQNICYGSLIQALMHGTESADALLDSLKHSLSDNEKRLWDAFFSTTEQSEGEPFCEEEAQRFFSRLLSAVAGGSPPLLLVDDAEFLDRETLDLFRVLEESASQYPPLSVLMTANGIKEGANGSAIEPSSREQDEDLHPFSSLITESPFQLKPFGVEGVEKMLRSILPTLRPGSDFHNQLHQKSQGNPLYVEEALKLLIRSENLVYQRSAWTWKGQGIQELPDSLESLLEARLLSLDPEVRDLIAKASVLGPNIDLDLLSKTEGVNQGHILDLLDKARKFGVLDGLSDWGNDTFRFNSKTARNVCYDQVPEEDRIAWHLQMAQVRNLLADTPAHLQMGPMLFHSRMAGEESLFKELHRQLARVGSSGGITLPESFSLSKKKKNGHGDPVPVSKQGWQTILSILHLLRAAVQTARLYPESSQAVAQSRERLLHGFEQAFQHTPSVHLSEADGTLLVNGETPIWKGEEKTIADNFCKTLSDAGLKDVSFQAGLAFQEVERFLAVWLSCLNRSVEPPAAWSSFEDESDLEHVQVNAKVYVAVSDADLLVNGFTNGIPSHSSDSLDELSDLLTSLQEKIGSLRDLSGDPHLAPDEGTDFRKLLEGIQRIVGFEPSGFPVAEIPSDPRVKASPSTACPGTMGSQGLPLNVEEDPDVRSALADILSSDSQREARGYKTISEKGEEAVEHLYFSLMQTDDARAGRVCVRILDSLSKDLEMRILRDLERQADPSLKKRLLQYAVPFLDNEEEKKKILLAALQQEEGPVAMEALHQIKTSFSEDAPSLLLDALPALSDRMGNEVCASLGHMGDPASVPQLLSYLSQWKTLKKGDKSRFQESVCHALAHYQEDEIVNSLGELLRSCSSLPWRKTAPVNLRKAALKALEMIGGEAARSLLKQAESDKDPWIRYRIKQYLGG